MFSSIAEYSTKEKEYFADLISEIQEFNHAIKVDDIRKMMGMGKKISKQLNRFLHENYNIWISPEMKDSDFESDYQLDNMLDIKYYEEDDYEGTPSLFYFVGTKKASLKTSIHNACAVRKVVSQTGLIEYKELFPLLAVEFVRNKQYTVIPFPFKYLREWK